MWKQKSLSEQGVSSSDAKKIAKYAKKNRKKIKNLKVVK